MSVSHLGVLVRPEVSAKLSHYQEGAQIEFKSPTGMILEPWSMGLCFLCQ